MAGESSIEAGFREIHEIDPSTMVSRRIEELPGADAVALFPTGSRIVLAYERTSPWT